MSGLCVVAVGNCATGAVLVFSVGTAAGTKVVDVELSMATDGIACGLVFGRLVPASEMGGAGLTVFSGWEVLNVVGITAGMLVADVKAEPAPAPPAISGAVDVGDTADEDACVLRTVVVDGLDVGTTAVEGALCVVNVVDGSIDDTAVGTAVALCAVVVGKTLVCGIAGTEALCTVPAAADAVEKPDVPGTAGTDEEWPTDDTPP